MAIWCPLCGWRPTPLSRWQCRPGCLTAWDTFATHARCPGCDKQWRETQCLSCFALSLHEDWYHEPAEDEVEQITTVKIDRRELVPV